MMENPTRQIDKVLFDTALKIHDPEARREFLNKACGGDESQVVRIEDWLSAQDAADIFFRAATFAKAEIGSEVAASLQVEPIAEEAGEIDGAPDEEGPGSRIGRYRLLERIGEGGCGVVHLAKPPEPVDLPVALKIIRLGMDTEKVIARFEMERQALAMMDHPNIARVLDAGTTDRGRPYFVMELVRGVKITEHCDSTRLGLRQRLELFIQVCGAIQHAHQKGIIHRDIKPSNILVSSQDGLAAVPKVIDFGIARAVEGRCPDDTEFTACDPFIGTPSYMSPEQAEGVQDADTRSDVYSLGVLLYELLTGRTPFDSKKLARIGMFETLRILREEEPPAPHALLSGLPADELEAAAVARGTSPAHLVASIKGDLDWIVIKAMAKDRGSRYNTVNGLVIDIRRFLNDEPISARPPSRLYLLGKLARRNKIAFVASAAVVMALAAGMATSSWFYVHERAARQEQEILRRAAESARANEARLLRQSKARESVSQAAMLLADGKIEEADALLVKTPLNSIEPSMEAATVFYSLGNWNAIRQRWNQAAECYHLFLLANRMNRNPEAPAEIINLIAVGPTLLEAGDLAGYSRFREEAISRCGKTTDPVNAAILLKTCLLLPADEGLLDRLRPFAELDARILSSDPHRGLGAYTNAFMAMGLGLMEYRRGSFSQALEWSRQCLEYPDKNEARSATAHTVAAMAAQQLGQFDRARAELAQAQEFFAAPFFRDVYYPRGEGQGYWQDWAIARVLLREAVKVCAQTRGSSR